MAEGSPKEGKMYANLFNLLPEDCIVMAVSATTPRDACRLAAVSKMFESAANSDRVWSRFMPSDLAHIINRSDNYRHLFHCMSKKDLFFLLAQYPLLIDGGTKSISLEKLTGKKCCCISARDLAITWGDSPRYWQWHPLPESRFSLVAELSSVCWLEIRGKVKASLLSPDTSYAAYFSFKMTDSAYGFYNPAEVSVKIGEKTETRNVLLDNKEVQNRLQIIPRRMGVFHRIRPSTAITQPTVQQSDRDGKERPRKRGDGWMEVEVGEFFVPRSEDDDWEVELSVLEVNGGNWKSGLVVEGFEIRPKSDV